MFIDGNSTSKQKQRQTTTPLRSTDTNKIKSMALLADTNSNNSHNGTSRRKSRKSIKTIQEATNSNENKTSHVAEDIQSISFIDEDDEITTTHSNNDAYNEQNTAIITLPNDDEFHSNTNDIDTTNKSNTTVCIKSYFIEPFPSLLSSQTIKFIRLYQRSLFRFLFLRTYTDVFFSYVRVGMISILI